MRARIYRVACAALILGLICYPADALIAAREALAVWANSFAPAMLPYFVVLPALSCEDAARLYARLFGRALGAVAGCPGQAAGAIVAGMLSGSPAGAITLSNLSAHGGFTRASLTRAAVLCGGLSPAFLLSAVGAGMLGAPGDGVILLRAQLIATALCALILRRAFARQDAPVPALEAGQPAGGGVSAAAASLLNVCVYMVLFGVISRILTRVVPLGAAEPFVLALTETAGGCAAVAGLALPRGARLVLLSFFCGFGGLSVAAQNLSRLRAAGVRALDLLGGRLLSGALCAAACACQLRLGVGGVQTAFATLSPFNRSGVIAAALLAALGAALVFFSKKSTQ